MKNKTVKRLLQRSLAVFMAATLSLGSTATVFADEGVDNHVDEWGLSEERVDSDDAEYNNVENSGDAAAQEMVKAAEEAKTAADNAANTVEDLKETVENLENNTKVNNLNATATTAEGTATLAETKAADDGKTASTATANANEASEIARELNGKAENDIANVNETASNLNTDVKNDDGTIKNLVEAVEESKGNAQAAANEAKDLLTTALQGESKDDVLEVNGEEKTVEEIVEMIKEAAEDATAAADEANALVETKEAELNAAIGKYNLYAMAYGKPLYLCGEEVATYDLNTMTEEDFKKYHVAPEFIQGIRDTVGKRNQFDEDVLAVNTAQIEAFEFSLEEAKQAATDATTAADSAVEAVKEAKTLVTNEEKTGYADVAEKKAEKAINYETDIAGTNLGIANTNLEAAKKDTETAISEQTEINETADRNIAKYSQAITQISGYENVRNTNQDIIDDLEDESLFGLIDSDIDKARKTLDEGLGHETKILFVKVWVGNTQKDLDEAQAVVDKYDAAVAARNQAKTDIDNYKLDGVHVTHSGLDAMIGAENANKQSAQAKVERLTGIQNSMQNEYNSAKQIYDTKVSERDARVAKVESEHADKAYEAMIESVKSTLSEYSDGINQVEYDKALNEWANDAFGKYNGNVDWSWKFWETFKDLNDVGSDAFDIRDHMDNTYDASLWNEVFNTLAISQWIVSTDEREEIMDDIIAGYKNAMVTYEKELAVINADFAKEIAKTSVGTINGYETTVDGIAGTVATAKSRINAASDKVDAAKETYDDAVEALDAAKEKVANLNLTGMDLAILKSKIAEAEKAVNDAKTLLESAKATEAAAKAYSEWATELIKEHTSDDFAKVESGDENDGEFEFENVGVDVVVPYSVYREYTKALLENYDIETGTSDVESVELNEDLLLYWETTLDENGRPVLTGNYVTKPVATGTYFVGYEFAKVDGEYHVNGYMYSYVAPSNNTPNDDGSNDGDGSSDTSDEFTELPIPSGTETIATLTTAEEDPNAEVLGARRNTRSASKKAATGVEKVAETENEVIATTDSDVIVEKEKAPEVDKEKETVTIEDGEVALAGSLTEEEKQGMSWWWLLIVAALGATGVAMYRRHLAKKKVTK